MRLRALWRPDAPYPSNAELRFPKGAESVVVHRADDEYRFLHDSTIAIHDGTLCVAWYNCPEGEIVGESVIRGRTSGDGGRTWSEPEMIARDAEGRGVMYVPAALHSDGDTLRAFVSTMTAHDVVTGCEIFTRGAAGWSQTGPLGAPFVPNASPVAVPEGYLMAGRVAEEVGGKPLTPAVALAEDLDGPWEIVALPTGGRELKYPETAVIAERPEVTAFIRDDAGFALVCLSDDGGATWRGPFRQDMRLGAAKMCAGVLSTGQRYVVFNTPGKGYRDLLTLAVTAPGEGRFRAIWKLRDGPAPELDCGP